jgi:hypothetical protein
MSEEPRPLAEVQQHRINPALEPYITGIGVPLVHPENARLGDVAGIKASLERFGQVRPILVQNSSAFIVAGNHTFKAARELGWTHVAVVGIDLPDDEAMAYMIADNRLGDLATWDDTALAGNLQKLMMAGKLHGTGWSPDQVDDMLSAMDALPEVEPEEFEGAHSVTDDELAHTFRNRSQAGPLRQFVVLYSPEVGEEVEGILTRLGRAWGVTGARDVILEALRRANRNPPVEHLTAEEARRADAPPEPEVDLSPNHPASGNLSPEEMAESGYDGPMRPGAA